MAVQGQASVGGLPFQGGIPCCNITWGFPGDRASPIGHSLSLAAGGEELAFRNCRMYFAFKIRFLLKMPGVPDAGLIFKQDLGGGH